MASALKERYRREVISALQKEFNYKNPMQVPSVNKVVVNIGLGEVIQNAKAMEAAVADLAAITGRPKFGGGSAIPASGWDARAAG